MKQTTVFFFFLLLLLLLFFFLLRSPKTLYILRFARLPSRFFALENEKRKPIRR